MATDKTKAEKEYTVEEKLKTLYDFANHSFGNR